MFHESDTFYLAGHRSMVGSAIYRALQKKGLSNILTHSRNELDLSNQASVEDFFSSQKIDYVIIAAAKVGGINANNQFPADFIYENLMIEANIIHQAYLKKVKKLLFLGSSCIYPKEAVQPMREEALLTGPLEPTNEPYAIAKITGIKLCESYNRQYGTDFRSIMPTNLYGPCDNFNLETSHVVPALIRKTYEAKQAKIPKVTIWGTGRPLREFLHVDDLADAALHILAMNKKSYERSTKPMLSHINVGSGQEFTIRELAEMLVEIIGYEGELEFDTSYPDGTMRKLMDNSRISQLGWEAKITLRQGLAQSYEWFLENEINKV